MADGDRSGLHTGMAGLPSGAQAEIESLRAVRSPTRRVVAPALEDILYEPIPVLDHGFIRVIDYMGDDSSVVQAARVSYGRGTTKQRTDAGLIGYLMRHRHTSPFEMCEIKLHVKLPIFVARQWIRHRTASVNEYSGRYSVLDREFYVPRIGDLAPQSQTARQGRAGVLPPERASRVLDLLRRNAEAAYEGYETLLADPSETPDGLGLARELARMNLTLSYYTQWYWKIDLHNLLHFVEVRASPDAQLEIRAYALVLLELLRAWVPQTAEAFRIHRLEGVSLSSKAIRVIRAAVPTSNLVRPEDMSDGEWRELLAVLDRNEAVDPDASR